jgi:Asp-tRNA(Asn)/Glu-tRNA(Gln) amidotransferase A subunit family amidase
MPFPFKQELLTLDAVDIKKSFEDGKLDIIGLVSEVIRQIKNENNDGHELRAFISMAAEGRLLERAKKLDRERLQGQSRG